MAIPVRRSNSDPVVIQVAPLINGEPFPTLFWLVDSELNYRIDHLEARGVIAQLQTRIDNDRALQIALAVEHRQYIALRQQLMTAAQRQLLQKKGFLSVLAKRGIGGIANFGHIRCLHTHYAAHLVHPNTVGKLTDGYLAEAAEWAIHTAPS